MISVEREYHKNISAEENPGRKEKPAKEEKSVEETRKEQRKHADPEEQSPKRKGYG